MTWARAYGVHALVALGLLVAALWLAQHTVWAEVEVPQPENAALRRDPELRLKQMLTRLGAQVEAPDNLDRLPPPGATLLLASWEWNLFPERTARLRRWVEAGGQLVVPASFVGRDDLEWAGIERRLSTARQTASSSASAPAAPPDTDTDTDTDTDPDDRPRPRPRAPPPTRIPRARCPGVHEPADITPAYGQARGYATCLDTASVLASRVAPSWALDGQQGHVVLRVPVGRGTVTASASAPPWDNQRLLERDNGPLVAAAIRAGPGQVVWIVTDERRPPLLQILWERGRPAVLFGAAALAFALWRGARRFGPALAPRPTARRSMAEQVRGTARFIQQRGSPALHAAQSRALDDAARPRIRGYDTLTRPQRAAAIAGLTGLDSGALATAVTPLAPPARHPPATLALLETARRRLRAAPPTTA